MADAVLVEYVKRSLSRGATLEEITRKLKSEGWSQSDVDSSISAASLQMQSSKKASGKLWLGIVALTIAAGVTVMVAVYFVMFGGEFNIQKGNANITDLEACEAKTDGVYKALCYTDLARAEDDMDICNNLRNTDERKFKDICIRDFAVGKMDIDLCVNIENDYIQEQCIERIKDKAGTA